MVFISSNKKQVETIPKMTDAEKNSDRTSSESSWSNAKRTTPQSNPRKQEVIPKICVM